MQCLSCHYKLDGLTEHRCPECGRAFDPTRSETFTTHLDIVKRRDGRLALVVVIALIAILAIIIGPTFLHHFVRFFWIDD